MTDHKVVSREEWAAAREELLDARRSTPGCGDELARQRRELPWVRVEKEYRFETDDGPRTLAELFDGRTQLLVYHFMFGPSVRGWLPDLLLDGRHRRRRPPAPACARRDDDVRLAGAAREAAGLQAADGLEHALGLVGGNRLQLRPRLTHAPRSRRARRSRRCSRRERPRPSDHNAESSGTDVTGYGSPRARLQRLRPLDDGTVYHDLRNRGPRRRVPDGLLRDPRPCAEGAGRGRMRSPEVGLRRTTRTTTRKDSDVLLPDL